MNHLDFDPNWNAASNGRQHSPKKRFLAESDFYADEEDIDRRKRFTMNFQDTLDKQPDQERWHNLNSQLAGLRQDYERNENRRRTSRRSWSDSSKRSFSAFVANGNKREMSWQVWRAIGDLLQDLVDRDGADAVCDNQAMRKLLALRRLLARRFPLLTKAETEDIDGLTC